MERRLDALLERLGRIEDKVGRPIPSPVGPTDKIEQLETEKRKLEKKLKDLTSENEALKARLGPAPMALSNEQYRQLIYLANDLASEENKNSTSIPSELLGEFSAVPESVKHGIFYHTYLLTDSTTLTDTWLVGERLFSGHSELKATNLARAHAIHHFLIHSLASEFAKSEGDIPPQELLDRFNCLPDEERRSVLSQLHFILKTSDSGHDPFYGLSTATNQERSQSFVRSLLARVADYHRHHLQTRLNELEGHYNTAFKEFERKTLAEIEKLSHDNEKLQKQLQAATKSLRSVEKERDLLSKELAEKGRELKELKERFDETLVQHGKEVGALTSDLEAKSKRIEELEQQAKEAEKNYKKLGDELDTLQKAKGKAEAELKLELQGLEKDLKNKGHELDTLQKAKDETERDLKGKLDGLEGDLRNKSRELDTLRKANR